MRRMYVPELSMGWVNPRVGLGWIGLGWVGSNIELPNILVQTLHRCIVMHTNIIQSVTASNTD